VWHHNKKLRGGVDLEDAEDFAMYLEDNSYGILTSVSGPELNLYYSILIA
jgi:hypothetical protein